MALAKVEFAVAGARRDTTSQDRWPTLIQPLPPDCWKNGIALAEGAVSRIKTASSWRGGNLDEACAKAGIDKISARLK